MADTMPRPEARLFRWQTVWLQSRQAHVARMRRPGNNQRCWNLFLAGFILSVAAGEEPRSDSAVAAETDSVKIGLLLPPDEPQARGVREGALLAAEQASPPGVPRTEVLVRGRVGQWGADGVEAARMVTDEGTQGLIAPPDGAASHLSLQISGRTAVPVITLCPDSSVGRTGVPWLLRIVPGTIDEAKALFRGVTSAGSGPTNRWLAVVPEGRAGREVSSDLRQAAQGFPVSLEEALALHRASANAAELVTQVLRTGPAGVLIWLAPLPAAKFAGSLRAAGYRGILAGPSRLQSREFIEAAGSALDGFIIPAIAGDAEGNSRWRAFETAFQRRWGHPPDALAAMSYDATALLAHLLQQPEFRAPPHRLASTFSWPGATGELRFDANGHRQTKLELCQGRRDRFVPLSKSNDE